jgi:hypothetical protein
MDAERIAVPAFGAHLVIVEAMFEVSPSPAASPDCSLIGMSAHPTEIVSSSH